MTSNIIIVIAILLVPRLMVLLSARFKFLSLLGPVFLCYGTGFLLSFIFLDSKIAMSISEILVPISIPLILFSADLSSYKKLARPVTKSFLLLIISVLFMSTIGFFLFNNYVAYANKFSGMMTGLYTGGTPNLIAVSMALGVDDNTIVIANTVDLIVGGFYFFLLVSIIPAFIHKFLPKKKYINSTDNSLINELENEYIPGKSFFSFKGLLQRAPKYGKKKVDLSIMPLNKKQLDTDIKGVYDVFVEAQQSFWEHLELPTYEKFYDEFLSLKHLLDPNLIHIARINNQAVGFIAGLPDYNQVLYHFKGKLNIFSILKFLYYRNKITRARMFMQFVIPKYQKSVVTPGLYLALYEGFLKKGYTDMEASTIAEFNMNSLQTIKGVGFDASRIYRIYKKSL